MPVIDRIFRRLAATYGAAWERALGSAPADDVKAAWANELAGFAERLHDIGWALEHLPERVPNPIEFRALCRAAPAPEVPRIEQAAAAPQVVRDAMARLGPLRVSAGGDEWARRILAKHARGEPVSRYARTLAAEALGRKAATADAPAPTEFGNGLTGAEAC